MGADVVHPHAAVGPAARHPLDVDAELARQLPGRRHGQHAPVRPLHRPGDARGRRRDRGGGRRRGGRLRHRVGTGGPALERQPVQGLLAARVAGLEEAQLVAAIVGDLSPALDYRAFLVAVARRRVGRRGRSGGGAGLLDEGYGLVDLDDLALGGQVLGHHAGVGAGELDGDLVGHDLDDRLVLGDASALGHQPLDDLALDHRLGQLGQQQLAGHGQPALLGLSR